MPYKSKLQLRRKYGAESEASVLVDWLNADVKHPSLQRALTVREFLLRLESHAQQWHLFSAKEKASFKAAALWLDVDTLFGRLNESLNRYQMRPTLDPRLGDGGHITWRAPRKTRGLVVLCGAREVDEPEVIQRLLNLSRTPYLSYLRQCDHCKRWFYAIRSDQRFCKGKNCKQKHHQTGAKFREGRRKYMRKWRKDATERDQRAKDRLRQSKPRNHSRA